MRTAKIADTRNDLAEWGGPIIADRITEFYAAAMRGDTPRMLPLTALHRRFWKNLLDTDAKHSRRIHAELVRVAELEGIPRANLDAVDIGILDELMDVVTARFHHSPSTARDYGVMLLRAAASLTEARLLAA